MSGRRARRGAWHYVGLGLSWGLLGLILALAAVLIGVPAATGATPLTVLTSSMEPRLPPGTLVVIRPTPIDQIHVGQVVTYQIESGKPEVITHRVIEIRSESDGSRSFITRGDNNSEADPVVVSGQIRGTLWYSVPWIGYISTGLNGVNRSWLIPLAGVLLLGYAAAMIASAIVSRTRKSRQSASNGGRGRRSVSTRK